MTDDNEELQHDDQDDLGGGSPPAARVRVLADHTWVRLPPLYIVSCSRLSKAEWGLMHPPYEDGERVSILLGYRTWEGNCLCVEEVLSVPNVADDPTAAFKVKKDALTKGQLRRVVGVMHSHASGLTLPSTADLWNLPAGWLGGVVVDGEIVAWYVRQMQVPFHRVEVHAPRAVQLPSRQSA